MPSLLHCNFALLFSLIRCLLFHLCNTHRKSSALCNSNLIPCQWHAIVTLCLQTLCETNHYNNRRHLCLTLLEHAILLEYSINIISLISFFRRKSNEYKLYNRININTPYFIAFCRGCCSISQRENQLHGKILLKTLILNNRVRLDKEFGSFYFTIVFFAQILWLLIFSIATKFTNRMGFDLCSFAPARRQK